MMESVQLAVVIEDLSRYRAHFKSPHTRKLINDAAIQTGEWLRVNKESFSPDGILIRKPWWPKPKPTDDEVLLEEREQALRARAFEHGLLYMLILLSSNVLEEPHERIVQIATDPMTNVIVREFAKRHRAGPPNDSVTLSKLMELYGYSPNTGRQKGRSKLIDKLAPFGLVTAYCDGSQYSISAGEVGLAFYLIPYWKTVQGILPSIKGVEEIKHV